MTERGDERLAAATEAVRRAIRVTEAARAAGTATLTKADASPVTLADFAAQALVADTLRRRLGAVCLVGEESAAVLRQPEQADLRAALVALCRPLWPEVTEAALLDAIDLGTASPDPDAGFWTLDPVDGTKGFVRGQHYCTSLAYVVGPRPRLGVLGCPYLDADDGASLDAPGRGTLTVVREGSAPRQFCLGTDGPPRTLTGPAEVSDRVRVCESVESAHADHDAHARIFEAAGLEVASLRLDSQAKYAVVARGQADVFLRLPSKRGYVERIWDHAAGTLVAESAGLAVSDFSGQPLDFSRGRGLDANHGVLVAPPALHARLLDAIRGISA